MSAREMTGETLENKETQEQSRPLSIQQHARRIGRQHHEANALLQLLVVRLIRAVKVTGCLLSSPSNRRQGLPDALLHGQLKVGNHVCLHAQHLARRIHVCLQLSHTVRLAAQLLQGQGVHVAQLGQHALQGLDGRRSFQILFHGHPLGRMAVHCSGREVHGRVCVVAGVGKVGASLGKGRVHQRAAKVVVVDKCQRWLGREGGERGWDGQL